VRQRRKIKYSKREVSIKEMNENSNTERCCHQIRRQKEGRILYQRLRDWKIKKIYENK
jgi:hypothetical protein